MAVDLTGGLDPTREYVLTQVPETDGMRDAVNMWVWDDQGRFGLPRFAVEALAPEWDNHEIHLSVALGGGRLLRDWSKGAAHPVLGADGRATHFGAGPLSFECIEPFHHYRTRFDGTALDTSFDHLVNGPADTRRAALMFEIDCETAVPPWVQGTMMKEAADMLGSATQESAFMGGERLEQLCRARGRIIVDGVETVFTGGALRVRRQGVRETSGFWGHCWQSALFPSGRAFGYIAYPPRADGTASYNEGYVFTGDGALIPARATRSPWLTELRHDGHDASVTLETDAGTIEIQAETVMSMPTIPQSGMAFPPLVQSVVRYRWDGEEAFGMMERSNLPEKVTNLPRRG